MSWTKIVTSQPTFLKKTIISRRAGIANFVDISKAVITMIETYQ